MNTMHCYTSSLLFSHRFLVLTRLKASLLMILKPVRNYTAAVTPLHFARTVMLVNLILRILMLWATESQPEAFLDLFVAMGELGYWAALDPSDKVQLVKLRAFVKVKQ